MTEYVVDIESGEDLDFDALIIDNLPEIWNWCVTGEEYRVVKIADHENFRVGDQVHYYRDPNSPIHHTNAEFIECFVVVPAHTKWNSTSEEYIYAAFKGMGFSPIANIKHVI